MVVEASNDGQERVTAVLCSAGLDSTVLVAHEGQDGAVQPVYITAGLAWEHAEQQLAARLLAAPIFMAYFVVPRLPTRLRTATFISLGETPYSFLRSPCTAHLIGFLGLQLGRWRGTRVPMRRQTFFRQ